MWTDGQGADIRSKFDLVMRMYAGYDESAVWQEFGEMKFQTKEDVGGRHVPVRKSCARLPTTGN